MYLSFHRYPELKGLSAPERRAIIAQFFARYMFHCHDLIVSGLMIAVVFVSLLIGGVLWDSIGAIVLCTLSVSLTGFACSIFLATSLRNKFIAYYHSDEFSEDQEFARFVINSVQPIAPANRSPVPGQR